MNHKILLGRTSKFECHSVAQNRKHDSRVETLPPNGDRDIPHELGVVSVIPVPKFGSSLFKPTLCH